jgi:hypothetical protein
LWAVTTTRDKQNSDPDQQRFHGAMGVVNDFKTWPIPNRLPHLDRSDSVLRMPS